MFLQKITSIRKVNKMKNKVLNEYYKDYLKKYLRIILKNTTMREKKIAIVQIRKMKRKNKEALLPYFCAFYPIFKFFSSNFII